MLPTAYYAAYSTSTPATTPAHTGAKLSQQAWLTDYCLDCSRGRSPPSTNIHNQATAQCLPLTPISAVQHSFAALQTNGTAWGNVPQWSQTPTTKSDQVKGDDYPGQVKDNDAADNLVCGSSWIGMQP